MRISPRTCIALGIMLLVELAIYLPFYASNPGTFPPWLFGTGVLATICEFRWLLKRWQRSRGAWRRLGLCLIAALAGFQIFIALFTLCTALIVFWQDPGGAVRAIPGTIVFFVILLVAANAFFFWAWIIMGALTFALLKFLPGGSSTSATPSQAP